MTKDNTPQKQFEEFLLSRINRGDFVQRITEEDFAAKYTFGDQLGDGATSSVRVARNTRGEEFACKIIPAKMLVTHRSLFREVAILSKIQHPNIIRLVESFLTDSNVRGFFSIFVLFLILRSCIW
jgi:serine/threonine protein kinase